MEIILFSFLTAASGACFTSIGCRRAHVHHRRPGWHLILLGAGVTTLMTMLYYGWPDLFYPERWPLHKGGSREFWTPLIFASGSAAVVALLSSLVVVYYFRTKFGNDKPVA
jgi:ABC-type uncharacterized transport system permease subunit